MRFEQNNACIARDEIPAKREEAGGGVSGTIITQLISEIFAARINSLGQIDGNLEASENNYVATVAFAKFMRSRYVARG